MKKLIVVAATVLCGFMAQASYVAWTLTNVKDSTGAALADGAVYVFFVAGNSAADTSSWAGLEGKGKTAFTTALADANFNYTKSGDLKSTVAAGTLSYNAQTATAGVPELSTVGLSGSTKYSAYAVIFDTTDVTDTSHYYVTAATAASSTMADGASTTKSYMLTATSSATAANWKSVGASSTDVPEPTSGLLMLLGMAGLALRRKRA